jgi:hypothetical protein
MLKKEKGETYDAGEITVELVDDSGEGAGGSIEESPALPHLGTVPVLVENASVLRRRRSFNARRERRSKTDHPDSGLFSILLRGSRQSCIFRRNGSVRFGRVSAGENAPCR